MPETNRTEQRMESNVEMEQDKRNNPVRDTWMQHRKTILITVLFVGLFGTVTLARHLDRLFRRSETTTAPAAVVSSEPVTSEKAVSSGLSFHNLDLHPDLLYSPYLAGSVIGSSGVASEKVIGDFRDFLALYEQRQGQDDNFTIRVLDGRNGRTLEVSTLDVEKRKYEREGRANWDQVDRLRRHETSRLLGKYVNRGIPRKNVVIRWGRANQVKEARENERPIIEYEVRMARYLGLSLLSTEIGTVETFNRDRLISTVGARSRYQMMPYLLEQNGINRYPLKSAGGKTITVVEEWNPLLTMEPAFLTLKGYANAVGHEIPGISAYHSGPANLFNVYRMFLTSQAQMARNQVSVMDAYAWAVTEGFDQVSATTTFKQYSRGYVATAYGSLKATENLPLDFSETMRTERVQLQNGKEIFLSQLLNKLGEAGPDGLQGVRSGVSLYATFREMNPHIELRDPDGASVPSVENDIKLVSNSDGKPVRFFLPLGSSEYLKRSGIDWLDDRVLFRFDRSTYGDQNLAEKTRWDLDYDALVNDIAGFGFTLENRDRLNRMKSTFEELAASNPTPYRLAQLKIIRLHASMWNTSAWERLASTTAAVKGALRIPVKPTSL